MANLSDLLITRRYQAGNIVVSVVAGSMAYSHPRSTIPWEDYTAYEVGVLMGNRLVLPSEAGFEGDYDGWWEEGGYPVGAYVPAEVVEQMIGELTNGQ